MPLGELEADHRAGSGCLAAVDLVARVRRKAWIVDAGDLGVYRQHFGDALGVCHVAVHAHAERLDAAHEQERVERPEHAARGVLDEGDAPGEVGVAHDHEAGDEVRVAAEVLGGGVDHHVGAELERPLQVGRHERVVHDGDGAVLVGDRRRGDEVGDLEQRVRGALEEERLGPLGDGSLEVVRTLALDDTVRDAEVGEDLVEHAVRPAVHVAGEHDLVARREEREHRGDGGHPRGEGEAARTALELGDEPLEGSSRGVARARVLPLGTAAHPMLPEGRRLVDGQVHRPGDGVGSAARMDEPRCDGQVLAGHAFLLRWSSRDKKRDPRRGSLRRGV